MCITDLFFCPTKSKIVNLPELVCSAKGHVKTAQDPLGVPSTTRFLFGIQIAIILRVPYRLFAEGLPVCKVLKATMNVTFSVIISLLSS